MFSKLKALFKEHPEDSINYDEITRYVNRIIDICLLAFGIFALPIVVISLCELRTTGLNFDKIIQVVALIVAFLLLLFRNRFTLKVKSLTVLSFLFIAAFTNMATMGVISDGPLLLFFTVGLIAAAMDLKHTITALLLVTIGYFIVGYLFVSGVLHNDIDINENQIRYSGWISDILIFLLLSVVLVIAVTKGKSKFLEFMEKISKTTEELSVSRDRVIASQKSKNEFLDNIGHEIRTPLNHIIGYVELLKPSIKEDINISYLNKIVESSDRLLDMVNTILDLSDLEKGNFESNFDYFNFNQFITEISSGYIERAEERGLNFDISIPEDLENDIYMDKPRLSIALVPLLDNAVSLQRPAQLIFQSESSKSTSFDLLDLVIRIRDSGQGMDPNFVEKSADYFTQQDGSASRSYEGLGIGLSLSKKVIERLGGKFDIESVMNEGTCITISLTDVKTRTDDPLRGKGGSYRHLLKYSKSVKSEISDDNRVLLDEKVNDLWADLNTLQSMDKVKEFGNLLKEEGARVGYMPLTEYGESILQASKDFDIDHIINLLASYPDLLERFNAENKT